MAEGKNQYAPATGIPALRQAIAAKTARCYGRAVDADAEVTVTSGASEAIFNAILALVSPGEEVIVLDPCYDCYEPAIDLAGAVPVHVPLDPVDFSVDWQRVRDAITPRTRAMVITNPHNPTGAVLTRDELMAIAELCREHDMWLVADEVYNEFIYTGEFTSILALEGYEDRTIALGTLSKSHRAPRLLS
jgi:methionine aminotransferase